MNTEFLIRGFTDKDYNEVVELWIETDLTNPARKDTLETIHKTLEYKGAFLLWSKKLQKRLWAHHGLLTMVGVYICIILE